MAKRKLEAEVASVKQVLEKETIVFGSEQVLKKLRVGKAVKVFMSVNCPVEEDIEKYAVMTKTEIVRLDKTNKELGTICRKPFDVSVFAVVRE